MPQSSVGATLSPTTPITHGRRDIPGLFNPPSRNNSQIDISLPAPLSHSHSHSHSNSQNLPSSALNASATSTTPPSRKPRPPNLSISEPSPTRSSSISNHGSSNIAYSNQTSNAVGPGNLPTIISPPYTSRMPTTPHDHTWAMLQLKLNDIEHHASSHTFNAPLAELRKAQVALAQAWRRTEDDLPSSTVLIAPTTNSNNGTQQQNTSNTANTVDQPTDTEPLPTASIHPVSDPARDVDRDKHHHRFHNPLHHKDNASPTTTVDPSSASQGHHSNTTHSQPDTTASNNNPSNNPINTSSSTQPYHDFTDTDKEQDLLLAQKRREANDRHFDRARKNIEEVVSRLEVAAQAMHRVEVETRDVWVGGDTSGGDVLEP